MPSWEVIYKVTADFQSLTQATARARDDLKQLEQAAKRESDAETQGALKAAAAHDRDTEAIKRQARAMQEAQAAADGYNKNVNFGGRSSIDQHLSDIARERQETEQLARARQRGMSTPQQDFAFRQQEMQQRLQWNRALQQGYQTPDQYLQYLERQRQSEQALNQAWAQRATVLQQSATAAANHASALTGNRQTAQELANHKKTVQELSQAVSSMPQAAATQVSTTGADEAAVKLKSLRSQMDDLGHQIADPKVRLTSGDALAQLGSISKQLKEIDKGNGLDIQSKGTADLQQQFDKLQAQASRAFDDIKAKGGEAGDSVGAKWKRVGGDFADLWDGMKSSSERAAADVEGTWQRTTDRVKGFFAGFSGQGIGRTFSDLAQAAAASGGKMVGSLGPMGAVIIAVIQLLPELTAGVGAVAAVMAAVPGLVFAAAGAFTVFHSAIGPVVAALQAYMQLLQAQQAAQANPLQTAMQQAQQQHALSDAIFQVSQASFQSRQSQITDAHAVTEAQYQLRQAYVQAALQQAQSSISVADAQHSLRDSVYQTGQAQYQLNIAWQTATQDLAELELQVGAASLNMRGAQLQLMQAQQQYAQVMAQSNSTALERAQAAYQIQQAEENLKQVELTNTENETKLGDVRKYGAAQVFGVVAAQHALQDAQFSQLQAQKNLIIVQKQAADAQIQAAHAISDAVFGLQQAETQRSNDFLVGQHSVLDAQQSYQQALDTMALGLPGIASAQANYNTALSQLGPFAATAVRYLGTLFYWWNNNTAAQQAFFKQANPALRLVPSLIAPISSMLDAMASAAGTVAGQFVQWLDKLSESPAWKVLTASNVGIIRSLGGALLLIVDGFVKIAVAAAPFTGWLVRGVERLAKKFDDWATSMDNGGSTLKRWLGDSKPALHDVGQLLKSIVDFFLILAGGTPQFNKQGILTGVIPSPDQFRNLQSFEYLVTSLANKILPDLALVLRSLSSPQIENAITNLLIALATLLKDVVTAPGFQVGFKLFVGWMINLVNSLTDLTRIPGVGNILGAVASAVTILTLAKYTGLLALIGHLKDIVSWSRTAIGWLGRVGRWAGGKLGFPGGGGSDAGAAAGSSSAATPLDEAATNLNTAGTNLNEAAVALKGAAGAEEVAAEAEGAAAAEHGAAGLGMGAAGGAAGAAGLAALLPEVIGIAMPFVIAAVAAKWGLDRLIGPKNNQTFVGNPISAATNPAGAVSSIASDPQAASEWLRFSEKVKGYWHDINGFVNGSTGPGWWQSANNWFVRDLQNPVSNFFSTTLPNFFGAIPHVASMMWLGVQTLWDTYVSTPVSIFFTKTLPGWFGAIPHLLSSALSGLGSLWDTYVSTPVSAFFSKTLPSFLTSVPGKITNDFLAPVAKFFTSKVPKGVSSVVNWFTSLFAAGGSVAGAGDEDSVPSMLTPGEYVIRKGARSALEADYGPDALYQINNYDRLRRRGYADGGSVIDNVGSFDNGLGKLITGGLQLALGMTALGGMTAMDAVANALTPRMLGAVGRSALGALSAPPSSGQIRAEEAYALSLFPKFGWSQAQLPFLVDNWNLESGWNANAQNPTSTAYGIPQFLDSTWSSVGFAKTSDWRTQILAGETYIKQRYGSPEASDAFEHQNHYYARGGPIDIDPGPPAYADEARDYWASHHLPGTDGTPGGLDSAQGWAYWMGRLTKEKDAALHGATVLRGLRARSAGMLNNEKELGTYAGLVSRAFGRVKDKPGNGQNWLFLDNSALALAEYANRGRNVGWYARGGPIHHRHHRHRDVDKPPARDVDKPPTKYREVEDILGFAADVMKAQDALIAEEKAISGGSTTGSGGPGYMPGPGSGSGGLPPILSVPLSVPAGPGASYGSVPVALHAGGGDVLSMFAFGGPVPGGATFSSVPSSVGGSSRVLSSAAAASGAGQHVGMQFGDINIHNPAPERASDSITRRVNQLAFMAGRGEV